MPTWQTTILTAIGVLVLFGGLYFVWKKWLSPPEVATKDDEEREKLDLEDYDRGRSERVGYIERSRHQPITTKLFYVAVILLIVIVTVSVYSLMQSGSPSEMKYATQLKQVAFGTIIATGSLWFKARQDAKAGYFRVVLENDTTSTVEVPFDWELAEPAAAENQGKDVVIAPAFKKRRLLGLFWQSKLAADDQKAQSLDKARGSDRCRYEIPLDESTTWDYRNKTVTTRAKKIETVDDPTRAATHTVVPSERASRGELQSKEEEIAELKSEIASLQRMDAIRSRELDTLEEKLKNIEHGSDTDRQEAISLILSLLHAINGNQPVANQQENGAAEQAAALLGNGQQHDQHDARSD